MIVPHCQKGGNTMADNRASARPVNSAGGSGESSDENEEEAEVLWAQCDNSNCQVRLCDAGNEPALSSSVLVIEAHLLHVLYYY